MSVDPQGRNPEPNPEGVVADFLAELAHDEPAGGLPDDFTDLPAFRAARSDPAARSGPAWLRLAIQPAPPQLDARVALATGVPLVVLRGQSARRPRSLRAAFAAAAAACLLGGLWLFGSRTETAPAPRLVIVDVDKPIDTSFDPLAFGIWLADEERKR